MRLMSESPSNNARESSTGGASSDVSVTGLAATGRSRNTHFISAGRRVAEERERDTADDAAERRFAELASSCACIQGQETVPTDSAIFRAPRIRRSQRRQKRGSIRVKCNLKHMYPLCKEETDFKVVRLEMRI